MHLGRDDRYAGDCGLPRDDCDARDTIVTLVIDHYARYA